MTQLATLDAADAPTDVLSAIESGLKILEEHALAQYDNTVTCVHYGGSIACTSMAGHAAAQIEIPDGQEPFGPWLLHAVAHAVGHISVGRLVLIDSEGTIIMMDKQAGEHAYYIASPCSSIECVSESGWVSG